MVSFSDKMKHVGDDYDEVDLRASPAKKRRKAIHTRCEILDDIPASPFKKTRKVGMVSDNYQM